MTCGPYRNITLSTYTTRIRDVHPHATLEHTDTGFNFRLSTAFSLDVATKTAALLRDGGPVLPFHVTYSLKSGDGEELVSGNVHCTTKDVADGVAQSNGAYVSLELPGVVLDEALEGKAAIKPWWPVGYGDQNLYTFDLRLETEVRLASLRI